APLASLLVVAGGGRDIARKSEPVFVKNAEIRLCERAALAGGEEQIARRFGVVSRRCAAAYVEIAERRLGARILLLRGRRRVAVGVVEAPLAKGLQRDNKGIIGARSGFVELRDGARRALRDHGPVLLEGLRQRRVQPEQGED